MAESIVRNGTATLSSRIGAAVACSHISHREADTRYLLCGGQPVEVPMIDRHTPLFRTAAMEELNGYEEAHLGRDCTE